jgi:hypothetical protein
MAVAGGLGAGSRQVAPHALPPPLPSPPPRPPSPPPRRCATRPSGPVFALLWWWGPVAAVAHRRTSRQSFSFRGQGRATARPHPVEGRAHTQPGAAGGRSRWFHLVRWLCGLGGVDRGGEGCVAGLAVRPRLACVCTAAVPLRGRAEQVRETNRRTHPYKPPFYKNIKRRKRGCRRGRPWPCPHVLVRWAIMRWRWGVRVLN